MGFISTEENDLYVTAILAFLSTSIDDFIVFLFFIAIADLRKTTAERIQAHTDAIVGITTAYAVIIGISLLGLLLSALSSDEWVSLIGFVPLFIGLYKFYEILIEDCAPALGCAAAKEASGDGEEGKEDTRRDYEGTRDETAGLLESGRGGKAQPGGDDAGNDDGGDADDESTLVGQDDSSTRSKNSHSSGLNNSRVRGAMESAVGREVVPTSEEITSNFITQLMKPCLGVIISPFAQEVFATTIAVGSDNIAIYVAVFASEKYWEVAITIGLVFGMLYVWYLIANIFVQFELVKYVCANYSQYLIAPLLVLLGLYVLSDSVLWDWMDDGVVENNLDDT